MKCPSCDATIQSKRQFCTQCGHKFQIGTGEGPAQPIQQSVGVAPGPLSRVLSGGRRNLVFVSVGGGVFLVALFLAGAWLSSTGSMDWLFGERYSKQDVSVAYDRGFDAGEDEGYSAGFSAGETSGKSSGYGDGYSAGETSGYDKGYAAGEVSGRSTGYDDGYSTGRSEGYESGLSAGCQSVFTSVSNDTGYSAIVAWDSSYRRVRGSRYYTSSDFCD